GRPGRGADRPEPGTGRVPRRTGGRTLQVRRLPLLKAPDGRAGPWRPAMPGTPPSKLEASGVVIRESALDTGYAEIATAISSLKQIVDRPTRTPGTTSHG